MIYDLSVIATVRAAAEELQAMPLDREIRQQLHGGDLLFAQTGLDLDHFAAALTGNVVVMMAGLIAETKTMRAVRELDAIEQLQFLQDLHGPKDRGAPH